MFATHTLCLQSHDFRAKQCTLEHHNKSILRFACNHMTSERNNVNLKTITNQSNNEMRIWEHIIATTAAPQETQQVQLLMANCKATAIHKTSNCAATTWIPWKQFAIMNLCVWLMVPHAMLQDLCATGHKQPPKQKQSKTKIMATIPNHPSTVRLNLQWIIVPQMLGSAQKNTDTCCRPTKN